MTIATCEIRPVYRLGEEILTVLTEHVAAMNGSLFVP